MTVFQGGRLRTSTRTTPGTYKIARARAAAPLTPLPPRPPRTDGHAPSLHGPPEPGGGDPGGGDPGGGDPGGGHKCVYITGHSRAGAAGCREKMIPT